jgi:DNA-binding GntR family transcriptional regulator
MPKTFSKLSVAKQTYQQIEELIVLLKLKPGLMYSEKEIGELVKTGRTPVREALQRLETEGLVDIRGRRGIQITEVSVQTQLKLLEVRRPLQNYAVAHSCQRASADDRKKILDFAKELLEASKKDPESRAKSLTYIRQAHDLIVEACHNEFAVKTMRNVHGLSRRFWIYYMEPDDFKPAILIHAALLESVAENKKNVAIQASNDLIDYLEDFARKQKNWE